jgi:hypothetical protein
MASFRYTVLLHYSFCLQKYMMFMAVRMLMQLITYSAIILQLVLDYNDQKNIPGLREWIESINKEADRVRSDFNLFSPKPKQNDQTLPLCLLNRTLSSIPGMRYSFQG